MADEQQAAASVEEVAERSAGSMEAPDPTPETFMASGATEDEGDEDSVVPRKRQHEESNMNGQAVDGQEAGDEDQDLFDDDDAEAGRSSPAKKKKKSRRDDGDDNAAVGEDEAEDALRSDPRTEQERRRQEMLRRIDAAAKGPRRPKKKKADETDLEQAADDEVLRMRDMMMAAAIEDQEANRNHQPATAKLRLLKEAVETLQKTGYQQAILDNNLLEAVKMWLEPLSDKSLPSLNIQRALFPLLETMYIDTTSLKMSGLGKLMLFYTKKKKGVDKSIQRIADRLIESWSRPILKRSSSYRDRQQASREYDAERARRAHAIQSQRAVAESAASASQAHRRARIPESVTGNAFRFAPSSQVADALDDSQLSKLAERQRINKFKRSMQAAKR